MSTQRDARLTPAIEDHVEHSDGAPTAIWAQQRNAHDLRRRAAQRDRDHATCRVHVDVFETARRDGHPLATLPEKREPAAVPVAVATRSSSARRRRRRSTS